MPTLSLKQPATVPLEAESLSPDVLVGKSLDDIRALPLLHGKRTVRVDDFFTVDGEPGDALELHGDLRRVKWVGKSMTGGSITIHGSVGMHLGAYMSGGTITVHGDAADWVGGEMAGGTIRVSGNVGGQIGAAYRGSATGMSGGTILVGGSAGMEIGMRMKRGLIAVGGKAKDFAGLQMIGGTIVLGGGAELRTGAWMQRGTIISLAPLKTLPTFSYACDYSPSFLRIYERHLRGLGMNLPVSGGHYRRYAGDSSVPGKGELLIWTPA